MKTKDLINQALLRWGCPIHMEGLHRFIHNTNLSYGDVPLTYPRFETVRKALYSLVNEGLIRRVRPGVYSAYSSVRD